MDGGWKVTGGRILVKRAPAVKMVNGLYVPESGEERSGIGVVLAVSPERNDTDTSIHVGDEVVFAPHGGFENPALGDDILVLFPQEVMAFRTPRLVVPGVPEEAPLECHDDGNEVSTPEPSKDTICLRCGSSECAGACPHFTPEE